MKTKYLIRLDDACACMDAKKWQRVEDILDNNGVKPLVGIIPANADPQTMIDSEDSLFWEKAHRWMKKGWDIALHGYDHVCISEDGLNGLNPVWKRSEYAGVPFEKQVEKIRKGLSALKDKGFNPKYFFAPSHTFDRNTLEALRQESEISIISDTYSLKPYMKNGFLFIPCQLGSPKEMKIPGLFTICLHPNNMSNAQFEQLEHFLRKNQKNMISFGEIDVAKYGEIRMIDRLVQWAYFKMRRRK